MNRTISLVFQLVCAEFGVSSEDLISKDRHKTVCRARQCAMYLAREAGELSFPEIGRAFGNRDHTTVMSGCKSHARLMSGRGEFREITHRMIGVMLPLVHSVGPTRADSPTVMVAGEGSWLSEVEQGECGPALAEVG